MSLPFKPMTLDEIMGIRLDRLLAAFPGDELKGRRDPEASPYISPSQLKTASRCLEQYRLRYVRGEKERPASALVWGSADHSTIEWAMREKLVSHTDQKTGDVKEFFVAELERRVEEDGGAGEIEWKEDGGMGEVKDRGSALVGHYNDVVSPAIQPVAVEEQFSVDVAGVPVPIRGFIDLIARVPDHSGDRLEEQLEASVVPILGRPAVPPVVEKIIERKTSGRRGMSNEWLIQGRTYQLVHKLPIEFHLSLKQKQPAVEAFNPKYSFEPQPERMVVSFAQRVIATIASCFETYGPDEPWPATAMGGFADVCGYCGWGPNAAATCPWWDTARWAA